MIGIGGQKIYNGRCTFWNYDINHTTNSRIHMDIRQGLYWNSDSKNLQLYLSKGLGGLEWGTFYNMGSPSFTTSTIWIIKFHDSSNGKSVVRFYKDDQLLHHASLPEDSKLSNALGPFRKQLFDGRNLLQWLWGEQCCFLVFSPAEKEIIAEYQSDQADQSDQSDQSD
jgi:hypothetical protein